MARTGFGTRAWLGGLAAAGVIAAHLLAYVVVAPDAHHRSELLAATGHGSWNFVVAFALGVLVASLAGISWGSAALGERRLKWGPCARRLVALQVIGFTILELGERLWHGVAGAEVFAEPVFLVGLLAQVVIALVASLLLRVLVRVVALFLARRRLRAARTISSFATDEITRRVRVAVGGATLRGPPAAG